MRSLIFVLLATGTLAAPVSKERHSPPKCDTKLNRFHHSKDFTYNYEGETVSSVAGASSARSGLRIRARCVVKAVGPCQHVLKIDQVELWEAQSKNPGPLGYQLSQGTTAFAEELQAQDLVFRTNGGLITDILAHPEDPSHVLNIKRGILSALQVQFVDEPATLDEDDVVGKCKVHYEVKSRHRSSPLVAPRPKVVYKTRNLTECTDRVQSDIGIHVHSYEEKPLSLLNSHSTCRLVLTAKRRTQQVVCQEEHVFRPFSARYKNKSGAITKTRQVLELQSITKSESEPIVAAELRPISLKYEHAQPQSNQKAINDAFYLITRLSQDSKQSTKPDSAQHFSDLVFKIRKLNVAAMESLWQKVHYEEDNKMHEYFYDALPHCGSAGCAKVMSHAVRNNLVSHERGNMFLAGLAMAANPSKETVGYVLELCEEHPGRTAMLTLGTLIHKVCESSPQECNDEDEENPITKAENFFLSRLNIGCKGKTPEEFENILITLKAIGNAGRPVAAEDVLLKCVLNLDAPVNMSIAALEAFRRFPCNGEVTDQILQIYGEHNLDVEIRIAAYLALMKCPSPEVFKRVADILKNEVNKQVGSFVWSHMTNAMDSTEPVHGLPQAEMMKDALNGMKLREFNLNRLRFSRAWEGSFYSDVLRFGGSAQSHLIYHPNSFFPRSAMVNVTVDVLGASINVLEAAARFEGFEILIEQMFGEDGYYPDDRIMKMFNLKPHEERDNEEKTVKYLKLRGKRSIHDDINKVEKHLNKLHRTMDTRKHHPSGAVSVKMFGNEMRLASFDDISWLNDEVDKINMIDIMIALAKGGKKSFSKSMMFLDAETTVPTILGLPLKLSAKGTTVAAVELAGKFDIRNMFWGKMKFDVRGYVKPSAVVDIAGRMGVSTLYAEAGVLVNSSLYTVTQIKGNATYTQGETLKFEVGVPEEPVQFVNVSSSLFTTLNDEKLAIEGTPRRIEPTPCLNMTRVLGVTFCGQLSLPLGYRDYESPFFPFSGPVSFSLSMQRTDPKLTKYQLIAERLETEDENKYDVIAKMSTPGAMWERNLEANSTLWFKKDGKLFSVSAGAVGLNFGKFEATYNNVTHAVNLTYSAKDIVYGHPIVLNGHFFNNTELSDLSRELGFQLSASYKNYTIKQLTKLYKRSGVYGYVSNMTYWTGKYLYSSGELNIPKKSIMLVANHTCTKTEVTFNGNLGEEEDNFVLSFSNEPTKAGIELTGRLLKAQKEGVLRLFTHPFEQSFTLRGSYAKAGDEKGIRFTASHDNKNRVIRWYTGIVNATNEKSLKTNATVIGSKAEAVWTYFNLTQNKGIKFHGLLLNQSMEAVWSYVNIGQEKGLRFNGTGFNKTIEAAWTLVNLTSGKSFKFNASAINKTIEAFWSYVNVGKEKGLRFDAMVLNHTIESALTFRNFSHAKSIKLNATVLNKTLEAVWSYVNAGKEKGLLFNVTALNKTAEIMWSYFNLESQKGLRLNASALNKTIDATWTFMDLNTEKSLVFKAVALNKTIHSTWSVLNLPNEKSLIFNASAGSKSINATWSFLNMEKKKSLNFKASAVNKTVDATWSFLNLENEKSLKFKASAGNKTLNASWTFLNLENEKSLKFKATALKKTVNASWTFFNLENEKGLQFEATAVNKTVNATWTLLKSDNQNSVKFEASALNKTIEAMWTLLNLRNEKSLKFEASVLNRTTEATWTFFNLTSEKGLKFKANLVNKSIETTLSLLNSATEKSIKLNASALNKTIEAIWTFINFNNEKLIKFNATGFNRSAVAFWSYLKKENERSIKFNASSMKRTAEAILSYVNTGNERAIRLNASVSNKSAEAAWTFLNSENEKAIKFNASAMNKTIEAVWSYAMSENEKAIKFHASAVNKTIEAVWSYERSDDQRAIKFNASAMNKTIEAVWSYATSESEKAIMFHASAVNKTIEAVWSYERSDDQRAIKFNASAMNKTIEAVWSYATSESEKAIMFHASAANKTIEAVWSYERSDDQNAIKFNASAMNKSIEAVWSYAMSENEKAIMFHASAANKTIEAVWSYEWSDDQRAIKFNASAMNKTIEAVWSYEMSENEKAIKFHASTMNKSIDAVWSYVIKDERGIKFNASAMNKTIEAVWSYAMRGDERAIKFYGSVVNKTLEAVWSYSKSEIERSIKFNASALNKTVEAFWTYLKNADERAIKFHASAVNKSVEAVWSYIKSENERSIKFNASALNKTLEAVWTLINLDAEKGLKFNLAVMNKTMNTSLVFFRNSASTGLYLNMTCCNKSFDLLSKIVFHEKESKVIVRAAYQNVTVALVGLSQNSKSQKIACIYPEYLGQSHGKLCAIFTNSSAERSMALNLTVLNRTGELKTERFTDPIRCGTRLTAKFNKTIFFESWVSFFHTDELKSLHFNATVVNKSVGASLYLRNDTDKAIGFNATVLKKQIGVEGVWLNGKTLKEAAVVLFWNKTVAAKSTVMFLNNTHRKMLEYRVHIGRFAAEWQNTLISKETGLKELVMLRMLRNGSQSLFSDSSKLTYFRREKSHELGYQYIVKTMGRSFEYGWDASYNNYSNAEDSYHDAKVSLLYSEGKKVSLTAIYRNTSEELSNSLIVEYLPEKTMTQSLIWYKERKSVDVRVELIPRNPLTWTTSWNTNDGLSVSSVVSAFDKKIENWLQYSKSTGEYEGHFEICPVFPLEVRGVLSREGGLLFTTEIEAFKRTWNHKIDFKRDERKLHISVNVLPNAPVVLDASWDNTEGMAIAMDLKGFKKSLSLVWEYDKLTRSFTSGITIFKRTLTLTEKLDVETKTLFLTLSALNRIIGFTGRFDYKNYVVSAFVSYQNHKAGWFLRFNPSSRSIVFNVTVTPRISGQVVGEMPDDYRLQVTIQRKFGEDVVNESRLMYLLNAEASRVSLTWNTSTITTLMNRVKFLKTLIRNVTLRYYNLTILKGKNLTKEVQVLVKKLEARIKPVALKLYAQVQNYNYTGLLQNVSNKAQNLTQRLFNVTIQTLNDTINRLPKMMRNATELYKRIRLNATIAYKRFRTEVLPPIIGNITLHLKNISRDVKRWANNVSIMVNAVTVRGEKLGDIAKRVSRKVEVTTTDLVEKMKVRTRQLISKIREIEIRGQKVGPLFDKYMLEVKTFTCNFNASCILKNVTLIAKNLTVIVRNITVLNKTLEEHLLSVRNITVLNRTLQEHFKRLNRTFQEKLELLNRTAWRNIRILRKKASLMHQTALNFTKNLTKVLPKLMRNATIQVIHLVRNVTQQIRTIYIRVRKVTLVAYRKLMKTHRPLIKFGRNVFISVKEKANVLVLKAVTPIHKFAADLTSDVTKYLKPIVKPLVPMALDVMYQVRNITIRHVPIGHALDKALLYSLEIASKTLTSLNHTLYSNISAVITFISDHSQETPDEIVDFAIGKSLEFFNLSKKILNQSIELGFNLSRRAPLIYNKSLISINRTLQKLLKLHPREIMDISIRKIQVIAKNVTAEVLNVTKQLQALDLIRPVKEAWKEMDLKGKLEALELKAKWEKLLERVRAFNIKERAILVKYRIGNVTLKVLKEIQDITNLTQRVLNLTSDLVLMKVSKEAFVKESLAIGSETSRVFVKYGILAKNISFDCQRKLRNISYEMAGFYKNVTVNKTVEAYNTAKKFALACYNEHKEEGLKMYNLYKEMLMKIYEDNKEKALEKFNIYREKLTSKVNALIAKLRQFEDMTYEEIVIKAYEFSSKHGLALYKNVTVRAMKLYKNVSVQAVKLYNNITFQAVKLYKNVTVQAVKLYNNITFQAVKLYNNFTLRAIKLYKNVSFHVLRLYKNVSFHAVKLYENVTSTAVKLFNDTKNATLRAYNLTLVLVNRTKLMALQYYNATRNLTLHYYNLTRKYSLQYYNLTRNLTLQYYHKFYNLSHNYTLFIYNVTRNITLGAYNKTRTLVLQGIRYVNTTVVPLVNETYLKGKVLVLRYANKTVMFVKQNAQVLKVWYDENKEKTIEELSYEAYELAESKYIEIRALVEKKYYENRDIIEKKIKETIKDAKAKLEVKVEGWKRQLKILNKTAMIIAGEAISLYNQTANITCIAAKDLAAIFHPYVKLMHNQTIFHLIKAKNISLSLLEKAKNISLPLLEKARNMTLLKLNETRKLLNDSYKKFVARKDIQEFIHKHQLRERYAKAEQFIAERYNEMVEYVEQMKSKIEANIKERHASLKERYDFIEKKIQTIVADPKAFIERLFKKVLRKIKAAIKDTPIETVIYHEMWTELIEEVRQHELVEAGQSVVKYSSGKLRVAFEVALKKGELIFEKLRDRSELMAGKMKTKVVVILEKLLVKFDQFKAMKLREVVEHEYVLKTIDLARNIPLKVRNITLEAKNLTRKFVAIGQIYYKNITSKVKNYTTILKAKVQNYTTILKAKVHNYTTILKAKVQNFTNLLKAQVQNYTILLKAQVHNYTIFLKAKVQNYTNVVKAILQNYTKILNATIQNYTKIFNVTLQKYTKVLNATAQNYSKIIIVAVKNYTLILGGHYERIYKSHLVPFYRNYTTLVKKYRAIAEHYINSYKNATLKEIIVIARNWTIEKVNLTRVWINRTLERGMKYCRNELERCKKYYREELKPLYYSKVLPFYKNTIVPMYHNYSKVVNALRKNITEKALELKEKVLVFKEKALELKEKALERANDLKVHVIDMSRQAVQITLDSKPYAMLRKFGKMTIRESILEGRALCIRAYNFTSNVTHLAMNVTLEKLNNTKLQLIRALNTTLLALNTTLDNSKPVISFLNATRVEVIKTVIFISKYYGLEDAVKERVRRGFYITRNMTMAVVNNHGPRLLKELAMKTSGFVNTTIGYVNRTVGYLNVTLRKITRRFNKTIHSVRLVINKKFLDARDAMNRTIQTVRIAVNKTIQTVRVAVNTTIQTVRIAVNKTFQDVRVAVNKTINKALISIRNVSITIRNARIIVRKTIIDLRAAIPKYIQVTDEGITVVFPHPRPFEGSIKSFALASVERVKTLKQDALEKMESLKEEAVIKMNYLKHEAVIKFKSMKREALEKMETLKARALEKIETLKANALEKMEELKAKALEKIEKLKNEALKMMKLLKQRVVIRMETLKQNAIEKFDEVKAKAIETFDEVKTKAKEMSIRVRTIGKAWVAVAVNKTIFYRQKTYGFVMKFYNLTRNHHLTGKYINTTLHYLNITKDLIVFYRNQTQGFLINAYNLTKNHPLTKKYVNITLHYLNMTKDLAIAYRQKTGRFVRFIKRGYRHIKNHPVVVRYVNMTVHYFNVTKNFVKGLNMTQVKNVTDKYLSRALNVSRHCYNVTNRYLSRALNLSSHCYNVTNRYLSRALNLSRHCYNVTNRYLSRALNLSRHYSNVTKQYLSHALNLSRHWYSVCVNKTLNISIEVYKVAENVTLDIYNSSCLGEAMGKTKNYSKIAINVTMKLYLKALSHGRNVSMIALNKTLELYRHALLKSRNYTTIALNRTLELFKHLNNKTVLVVYNTTMVKKYLPMALNLSREWCGFGINVTRNFTVQAYKVAANVTLDIYNSTCLGEALGKTRNYSMIAFNKTFKLCRIAFNKSFRLGHHLYNKTILIVRNTTMVNVYLPIARQWCIFGFNTTRNYTVQAYKMAKEYLPIARQWCVFGFNTTRNFTVQAFKGVANVTLDIYNSTCLVEALGKSRNYSMIAFNKTFRLCRHLYNKTMLIIKNTTVVKKYLPIARQWCVFGLNTTRNFTVQAYKMANKYLPMARQWCFVGFNATRNFTVQAYKAVANITLDIYNSTCLGEALGKTRNYSMIAFNKTFRLCRHLYNKTMFIVNNTTMVKKYLPLVRQWCVFGLNISRNFTVQAYEVAVNGSLDIYNSTCLREVFGKTRNYSKIAFNETLKLCEKALNLAKNFTIAAFNKAVHCYRNALVQARNYSMIAFNRTIELCQRLQNRTLSIVYNSTLVRKCLPMALNVSRQTIRMVYNSTMVKKYLPMALNVSRQAISRIYNRTVLKKYLPMALNFSRQTIKRVYNCTIFKKYLPMALNISRQTIEMVYNCTAKKYLPMALNYSRQTIEMVYNCTTKKYLPMALNFSRQAIGMVYNCTTKKYLPLALNVSRQAMTMVYNSSVVKKYIPMALNFSRQWCSVGFNATRNFTVHAYEVALNITLDICNSTSLSQALGKTRNYSRIAFNQTMNICLKLYRGVYNMTLQRCVELRSYSLALYKKIREHETTVKYMNHARSYLEHSKKMMKTRVRNLHGAKRYMQKRINHQVSRVSHLLNPINWIPPFNSTAMIFGGPHVYTFDGTHYTFPGYQKPGCMYVLARDVRDNKFTILSQETAIIVVTEDSSVKIHEDGRVETIVKVTSSGKKVSDGYHSELPVETFNTTIQREGSFIVLRHDLGLEIICDVEHFLCTFNIAKWYHGRMAGLLGTNNNEFHDEMMTSYNTPTSKLADFVNSWEVTRDPECKVSTLEKEKPKCKESTYIQRCRELFKDKNSPLSHFSSVVDPEPFVKACELDYKECNTSTPKDMKHCNTTAAYIELVRLQGVWAEYLPECGRCGDKQIGQRWFQKAEKAVDVVILVHETSILKSYAEKLPTFLTSLTQSLDPKFSFRFGVMGFGGRVLHERPHAITLNGQLMNDLASVELAFEHLKFASQNSENDTGDALEAMAAAAYRYPFRPGATKIFLLLTSTDRNPLADFTSLESISNMLESKDIILNIIGKYRKFRGEVMGQNFRGNVFYRKKPEVGSGAAPLPEGEYVSLMKATKGSVFGLPFLGSENKNKFGALQQASASAWREQIKRDQYICKECFCARGDAGQGKTICKKNSFHKKC